MSSLQIIFQGARKSYNCPEHIMGLEAVDTDR